MMLAHPQLESVIDFSSPGVNTLMIENQDFFRNLFCRTFAFKLMDFPVRAFSPKKRTIGLGQKL